MLASILTLLFAAFVLGHLTARHGHYFTADTRATTRADTPKRQQKPHIPKGKEEVK